MPKDIDTLFKDYTVSMYQTRIIELETKVELLMSILTEIIGVRSHNTIESFANYDDIEVLAGVSLFKRLSLKQNAALQLVLAGYSNPVIADCMECTLSTAKVHVRGIAAKIGGNSRTHIFARFDRVFRGIDPERYYEITSLPKDWWEDPSKYMEVTKRVRQKTR